MKTSLAWLPGAAVVAAVLVWPANAADISKKYNYFAIYGKTAEDLDREIGKRGPKLKLTGTRHPGATSMEFDIKTKFMSDGKNCKLANAYVSLDLKLTLPTWKNRKSANAEMAIMWDTLSSDIKRHEERHAIIARNFAIDLERKLEALPRKKDCKQVQANAELLADDILKAHAKAQADFDKVEAINFEARLARLLEYRIERALKR
jgi:predicted secreted Zn-dependent protease